jgi:lantibiotic leader peptide-processing serine protease
MYGPGPYTDALQTSASFQPRRSMMQSPWYIPVLFVLSVAGCADEPVAPLARSSAPSANVSGSEAYDRHLVVFRSSNGIPDDFVAEVTRLGGTVDFEMTQVGAALVSNLSASGAAELARDTRVQSVDRDVAIPMNTIRNSLNSADVAAELNSPAAPQTAGLIAFQWNMAAIQAPAAWTAGFLGSPNVTVAIIDTGIDEGSETVAARRNIDLLSLVDRQRSRSFMPIEDAVVRQVFGPNVPLYTDLDGHGTNVASQVSSRAFNLAGVTSQTRLMAVKVCTILPPPASPENPDPDPGFCSTAAVLTGVVYAVDQGADVVNMSLGGSFLRSDLQQFMGLINRVLNYARSRGVIVVVSAGNAASDLDHNKSVFNSNCDGATVICVSATGPTSSGPGLTGPFINPDASSIFSNIGSAIDVAAPGGNVIISGNSLIGTSFVWSLCPRLTAAVYVPQTQTVVPVGPCGLFGFIGTSQASPHVAGLAALLVGIHGRNPGLIRSLILNSADQIGASGNDPRFGAGRINVARAVGR